MRTYAHLHFPRWSARNPWCISVKEGRNKVRYTRSLIMVNCDFKVSEPGRQRTLQTGQRNVHAWVVGTTISVNELPVSRLTRRAIYDPWKGDKFVDAETLTPITHAAIVFLRGKDVYYEKEI